MEVTSSLVFECPEFTVSFVTQSFPESGAATITFYETGILAPVDAPNAAGLQAFIGEDSNYVYGVIGGRVLPDYTIPISERPSPIDRAIEVSNGMLSYSPPTGRCRRQPPYPATPLNSTIWSEKPREYLLEREMEANVAALENVIKAPGVRSYWICSALRWAWRRKFMKDVSQ